MGAADSVTLPSVYGSGDDTQYMRPKRMRMGLLEKSKSQKVENLFSTRKFEKLKVVFNPKIPRLWGSKPLNVCPRGSGRPSPETLVGKHSKVMELRTLEFLPTRLWAAFAQTLVGKHSKVMGLKTLECLPTRLWAAFRAALTGSGAATATRGGLFDGQQG